MYKLIRIAWYGKPIAEIEVRGQLEHYDKDGVRSVIKECQKANSRTDDLVDALVKLEALDGKGYINKHQRTEQYNEQND